MKRAFFGAGALFGFLTGLALMAVTYLGNRIAALPFLPFDLFDWTTRRLPGPLVDFAIQSMVKVIDGLHIGPTASTAKLAEQIQALILAAAAATVFGLLLGWIAASRPYWLRPTGWIGGAVLCAVLLVVEAGLAKPGANLVAGLVWLMALLLGWSWLLARILAAYTADSSAAPDSTGPRLVQPGTVTRRNFLAAMVSGGAGLVVLGFGLDRFRSGSTSAVQAASGPAQSAGSNAFKAYQKPFGPQYTSGPAISPSRAVLSARFDPAPGTRPEVTAAADFYRIDINTTPPVLDGSSWTLDFDGLVNKPLSLNLDNLLNRNAVTQAVTLSCISNPVGGDLISSNFWTGVPFKDVLAEAGVQVNAKWIAFKAADGFYETMTVAEALDPRCLLVYAMNGQLLTPDHGFPLRIYIPGHYGMKQPKWLTGVTLADKPGPAYWVERGWDKVAAPETTSVIDTQALSKRSIGADGLLPLGGIAWSGVRGIQNVELQVDGGDWLPVRLRTPAVSPLTWVQWRYDWKAAPGAHTLTVRATDGDGNVQTDQPSGPGPAGATGLHSVDVNL